MIWVLAATYVLAFALLVAALAYRVDRRIGRRLDPPELSPPTPLIGMKYRPAISKAFSAFEQRLGSKGEEARFAAGVPVLFDLLAVSVTAGLSPRQALERAPEVVGGPLGEALSEARRSVALGASWQAALSDASGLPGAEDLRRLAIGFRRADRLGTPLADRLRELAVEVRNERRARREERARRAPVKMLFPLVFLILPAFVLAAVVPALLVATRDIL